MVSVLDCGLTGRPFALASHLKTYTTFTHHPVVDDWVIKGLGMSSRVCGAGYIKDPVPLVEKSRVSCHCKRFPPSFIHQV